MNKVLVTGGTGFIGAYILKELVEKGYSVRATRRSNKLPFFIKYNDVSNGFELLEKIEENRRVLRPPEREEYPYSPYEFSSLEEINDYKDKIISNNIDIDYLFQKSTSIFQNIITKMIINSI